MNEEGHVQRNHVPFPQLGQIPLAQAGFRTYDTIQRIGCFVGRRQRKGYTSR